MMNLRVFPAALLLLLAPIQAADNVDRYVREEMTRQRIPGVAVAIVRHGELVKAAGYGVADVDNDVPVTPDTVFEVASLTKQFTASLIMMLVEEKKLNLDDKVSSFLVARRRPGRTSRSTTS